jgi:hypothetical protein
VFQNISNGEIFLVPISTLKIPASFGDRELVDLRAQCNTTFLNRWLKSGNSWRPKGGIYFRLEALLYDRQLSEHTVHTA